MDSRIPWPVDMRGWEKVGVFGVTEVGGKGWRAGLEIWAKGNQRRLIEPGGPIVWSYQMPTTNEQEAKIWGMKEEIE